MFAPKDSIVAIATPPGRGGVGIVRLSGSACQSLMQILFGQKLKTRYAHHLAIHDAQGNVLDLGLVLYFEGPHSFTGEDVLEYQAHGGPILLDRIVSRFIELGARLADPGEFSLRAYLNGKIDLVQAEAISDLINANSQAAASSALASLQGQFSEHITQLSHGLIKLRSLVEACLDFPEEDNDYFSASVGLSLQQLSEQHKIILAKAQQGQILQEGLKAIIIGRPNVGKSSILNRLSQAELSIVTHQAGTTRDIIRSSILLGGISVELMDTAGLRTTDDLVEQQGITRATQVLAQAQHIFLVTDTIESLEHPSTLIPEWYEYLPQNVPIMVLVNKIDLTKQPSGTRSLDGFSICYISAQQDLGFEALEVEFKRLHGVSANSEGQFSARRRHLDAFSRVKLHLEQAFHVYQHALGLELVAEELLGAQRALNDITGRFTSDDLLGKIFSEFCIGK